jgi:cytochrome c oxidase subunit 3
MSVAALTPSRREVGSYVGMIIFLGAWGMCFAGLFFSYAVVRAAAVTWPPPGLAHLPIALPLVNTFVLAISSLTLHRAVSSVRAGDQTSFRRWLGITIPIGFLFLALQIVVWLQLLHAGLRWDTAVYGSVFYMLTVFHALHVLSGLFVLLYLVLGALRGKYTRARHTGVRMAAMFWHFVDAIWVVMFLSVYVF